MVLVPDTTVTAICLLFMGEKLFLRCFLLVLFPAGVYTPRYRHFLGEKGNKNPTCGVSADGVICRESVALCSEVCCPTVFLHTCINVIPESVGQED